jgi:rhamnulokinase
MRHSSSLLAIDLGAESGRGVLGCFDGERLQLQELHRFRNCAVRMLDTLYWDLPYLFAEVKHCLAKAVEEEPELGSIGVDTWGVDFGLVGRQETLLANPVHYRDIRTEGIMQATLAQIPRERIYEITGLQFLHFNTIFQLLALKRSRSPLLEVAETLQMMPDLFGWLLTGRRVSERTNATTTQLYDPRLGSWSDELCEAVELPRRIFPEIVEPGTLLGPLLPSVTEEVGATRLSVVAPATHDTASAVAAVPVLAASNGSDPPDWCYLSSGTWSLLGVEIARPMINADTLRFNFTNEGGVAGTTRLLKNIMGLWLVQECRRTWARSKHEFSYDDLLSIAQTQTPFISLIDPDDPRFLAPGDMPARIAAFCKSSGQPVPASEGAFVRCALESLALKYRWTIERLELILGSRIGTIHVVGGGARNALLCQFTADACNRPVRAGPVEATAVGNILMQALGRQMLSSVADLRSVVAHSFPVVVYEPKQTAAWDEAADRFGKLVC